MLKLVLGKHNLTAALSSYSRPEVITKSQSYFFSHSVKTMAVTATAKGITSRQLLIGTIGDQVRFTNCLSKYFCLPITTLLLFIWISLNFLNCCASLLCFKCNFKKTLLLAFSRETHDFSFLDYISI